MNENTRKIEELLDTQNYILSCIAQILSCMCDGSSVGRQAAGTIADEMQRFLYNQSRQEGESDGK